MKETYLGDAVYAEHDGWYIWLRTERENGQIDRIALEPDTLAALVKYDQRIRKQGHTDPEDRPVAARMMDEYDRRTSTEDHSNPEHPDA